MARNHRSARAAGTRFERQIADWLAANLDDRIDRRARTGAKDRGDIGGVRHQGERIVLELKNTTRTNLAGWIREAHIQAGNDDAHVGLVIHKRHGVSDPGEQWASMTVADLAWLLGADKPQYDE